MHRCRSDVGLVVLGAALAAGCNPHIPLNIQNMEPGDLVITEVMINPTAADHIGEWFELYAPGPKDVDIDGLLVKNEEGVSGDVGGADDLVVPAGTYALIARREEGVFASPELHPFAYYGQDPGLDDAEDSLELVAVAGTIDATYVFGALEATEGVAWQLDPAHISSVENDSDASWCAATNTLDNGDLGTPGALNDPCE